MWTARGLVTFNTFFVINLATRAVSIAGSTPNPDDDFMKQVARNLTDCVDAFLRTKRILNSAGVRVVLCPPSAPNCNAFVDRFVRSIQAERLSRMIFIGSGSLRLPLAEFCTHCNRERPHQGIGNVLIEPNPEHADATGKLVRRSRLGGLLSHDHRLAA